MWSAGDEGCETLATVGSNFILPCIGICTHAPDSNWSLSNYCRRTKYIDRRFELMCGKTIRREEECSDTWKWRKSSKWKIITATQKEFSTTRFPLHQTSDMDTFEGKTSGLNKSTMQQDIVGSQSAGPCKYCILHKIRINKLCERLVTNVHVNYG